ncbi:unnamed protein product [Didymodactylos carnosus]|uniref:Uncharacterized protein n=1 Tax=Didymodactylos carnosus TaxID=1234261 RepID=A0A813QW33_9BILA|nr:unnamed protein product [Didymodactylos carnosus]CAF3556911.1 unnamed protein product [Didymodactylos carnosus]
MCSSHKFEKYHLGFVRKTTQNGHFAYNYLDVCQQLHDLGNRRICQRLRLTYFIGEAVYRDLIQSNSGIKCWSSVVNCQQYVRLLIEFGLGLQWPDDVDVTDDVAPEIVDIGFFYQSFSASGSFLSNSPLISHHNSTDYNKYLLSQVNAFPPDEPILSSTVCDRSRRENTNTGTHFSQQALGFINTFEERIKSSFSTSLALIRDTDTFIIANRFYNCFCSMSSMCSTEFDIWYDNTIVLNIIGLRTGCFIIEALLQSNLVFFYNQSLLNQLQTYLLDNDRFNISVVALDPSLPTNYTPATTTGDILKMLMVED